MSWTSNSLFSIRQWDRESLWEFGAYFNIATLEVRDLNESIAITAMKWGLQSSKFIYFLDKILFQTYAEILDCTQKYIRTEEGATDWRQSKGKG